MNTEDYALSIMVGALALVISALLLSLGALAVDGIQSVRSWDAQAECRAQTMDHVRKPFRTEVRCVPFERRDDTYNIRRGEGA